MYVCIYVYIYTYIYKFNTNLIHISFFAFDCLIIGCLKIDLYPLSL